MPWGRFIDARMFALFTITLAACKVEGQTKTGTSGKAASRDADACAAGDHAAGERMISDARAQRLGESPPGFGEQRAELTRACEAGCAAACREAAHTSSAWAEAAELHERGCALGDSIGCAASESPVGARADELCALGVPWACAAVLEPAGEEQGEHADLDARWARVAELAAQACAADDGRSCAIAAWARCGISGQCDAEAVSHATKAASLVPLADVVETLAFVHCHAGQPERADASLDEACEQGLELGCPRSCTTLPRGHVALVSEPTRELHAHVELLLALQSDVSEDWYVATSMMDADTLAGFDDILGRFTPPVTEAGAQVTVPEALREQWPALVEAILRSPQLDAKKVEYWFGRLPDMNDEQRSNLFESLRKQWWVIPGEGSRTPQTYVDDVRRRVGGFGPLPGG